MKGLSLANIASACGGTYEGSEDARNGNHRSGHRQPQNRKRIPLRPNQGRKGGRTRLIEQVMEKEALCTLSEHPLTGRGILISL